MNGVNKKGFTLIEILVVIGLIAILAAIVLIAINPARQFAQGRDSQRTSNVNSILNAVGQRIADNKGVFGGTANGITCPNLPTSTSTVVTTTAAANQVDLSCLAPTYIPALPLDPSTGSGTNTGYSVKQDSTGRVWVAATATETSIPRTTDIYVVR
jgi:type IV pilus assembly protein PilA